MQYFLGLFWVYDSSVLHQCGFQYRYCPHILLRSPDKYPQQVVGRCSRHAPGRFCRRNFSGMAQPEPAIGFQPFGNSKRQCVQHAEPRCLLFSFIIMRGHLFLRQASQARSPNIEPGPCWLWHCLCDCFGGVPFYLNFEPPAYN